MSLLAERASPVAGGTRGDSSLTPEKVVTVLSISSSEGDHVSLRHLFGHTNWTLLEARSRAEALEYLEQHRIPVVICDSTLPDGSWKDVLRQSAALQCAPMLVVASRIADDCLWAEVLDRGGYNVVEKPFQQAELFRVISLAWLQWKNQWQPAPRGYRVLAGGSGF